MSATEKAQLFDSLTGLRGISALMVIITHCMSSNFDADEERFTNSDSLHASGNMAVLFFFVLSGFLLTYKAYCEILTSEEKLPFEKIAKEGRESYPTVGIAPQEDNIERKPSLSFNRVLPERLTKSNKVLKVVMPTQRNFLYYTLRRFFRIYPPYIIILFFSEGTVWPIANRVWERMFLLPTTYAHLWTIRVELTYYMMVPLFQLISAYMLKFEEDRRERNKSYIPYHFIYLAGVTFLAIFISWAGRVYIGVDPNNRPPIYQYMPIFWFGSLTGILYFYLKQRGFLLNNFNPSTQKIFNWIVEILTYLILVLIVFSNKHSSINYLGRETWLCQIQAPFISPLYGLLILLLVLSNEKTSMGKLFSCNLFLWTGKASYSIYLIQYAGINLVIFATKISGVEAYILVLILDCAFGWVYHRGIEEKSVKIGNILIKNLKARAEAQRQKELEDLQLLQESANPIDP